MPTTEACVLACRACAASCTRALARLVGEDQPAQRLSACASCAEICTFCANELTRGGPFVAEICGLCAKICRDCAETYERRGDHLEDVERAITACSDCGRACEALVA